MSIEQKMYDQLEPRITVLRESMESNEIPKYMRPVIERYVLNGINPGGFMEGVLTNNLVKTVSAADSTNSKHLLGYARLLFHAFPFGSYGSEEAFRTWIKRGGLVTIWRKDIERKLEKRFD